MADPVNSEILAIIPAYNASRSVSSVVHGAIPHLPVLVVDDGSTDNTAEIARNAGAAVISQSPNQGKGAALKTGFAAAITRGCQAIVMLDADGQHDPAEIPAFLTAFQTHHSDLVIGRRDFSAMPAIRRFSNMLGTALISRAIGQHIPDNQSGYRLISRRLLETISGSRETGYEFEVEMIATCVLLGYRLDWVPIRTIYGGEESHIRPLRHLANFLQITLSTGRRLRHARRQVRGSGLSGGGL